MQAAHSSVTGRFANVQFANVLGRFANVRQSVRKRLIVSSQTSCYRTLYCFENLMIKACVYRQPIRTNNDIEGWHNPLNRRAGGQSGLPLYSLIGLLDREARLTAVTIWLVSDKKLKRVQRKRYRSLQAKLFDIWEQYDNRQKTAIQLLKICLHPNGPARA